MTTGSVGSSPEPAVSVRDVSKEFDGPEGKLLALDSVSLEVGVGELICIVGPSGCGKTTLLRILQGLEVPTVGEVSVGRGRPGAGKSSFVFQRASLFPWRTVRRNVSFGLEMRAHGREHGGLTREAVDSRVEQLLQLTDLTRFGNYYPAQISGGMQQRVNLARALATGPDVLLMDEPFSALDAMTRERLQRDLSRIVAETATTAVFITHDIHEAVFLANRVYVMSARPGRIQAVRDIEQDTPRRLDFHQSEYLAKMSSDIWRILHPSYQPAPEAASAPAAE